MSLAQPRCQSQPHARAVTNEGRGHHPSQKNFARVSPLKNNMRARGAPDTTKARVGGWGMWRGEKNQLSWSQGRRRRRAGAGCGVGVEVSSWRWGLRTKLVESGAKQQMLVVDGGDWWRRKPSRDCEAGAAPRERRCRGKKDLEGDLWERYGDGHRR